VVNGLIIPNQHLLCAKLLQQAKLCMEDVSNNANIQVAVGLLSIIGSMHAAQR
jgi:hypothetical protein